MTVSNRPYSKSGGGNIVQFWEEVTALRSVQETTKRKKYMLSRINRKSLVFGEAFEDLEGLADLVRQHILRK